MLQTDRSLEKLQELIDDERLFYVAEMRDIINFERPKEAHESERVATERQRLGTGLLEDMVNHIFTKLKHSDLDQALENIEGKDCRKSAIRTVLREMARSRQLA